MSEDELEAAQRAYESAQEALHAARRKLAAAVLDAYANGEPVGRIAERTGQSPTSVWNTLAVHGITPRNRINGST
ncbi:hypothetical protein ACFYN3_40150 [Streptomyces lavendulae]|uniref:hypothetical protein n=1 Tax=Streptomyces lavendulae TaxID=1914 RepID=UPI0024A2D99B|nr:hypothetical protein [Streptomyces lavendulae]GLW04777.1 hypothetical protein Slala05_84070 [Streptomyces lavendulae subsp. lavendulae]